MMTEITCRHFESAPALRDHAMRGVKKLSRFYNGINSAHVVLDVEPVDSQKKTVEISLGVYRHTLTASQAAETHEEAINRCVSQLRRQILRYKSRLRSVDKDIHR